jgi:O-antigen ligase
MAGAVQRCLQAVGIFLTGAFTGILIFMIWAERHGYLVATPSLRLALMVAIPLALIVTVIPGLLSDVVTGMNKRRTMNRRTNRSTERAP